MTKAIMVQRSADGVYQIPGAAEMEDWSAVMSAADQVIHHENLDGWDGWTAAYAVKQFSGGDNVWYFIKEVAQ